MVAFQRGREYHYSMKREASYYRSGGNGAGVECLLCPHHCSIAQGKSGICGVREHDAGKLYTTIYGEVTSIAMDPIEKKPLYHFHPGSRILSIGTRGCNLKCPYCQNWTISQDSAAPSRFYDPKTIVESALDHDSVGIAYTYSEPVIWFEYVMDCARMAKSSGLCNVMVTNGYVNEAPLREMIPLIDAMNIDLKSFRKDTYKRVQKGSLDEVLRTIAIAAKQCHVELTTLIVTGINDSMDEMKDIVDWIASVDPHMPWHVSRYYPGYRHDAPATDIDFMLRVFDMAREKLHFVFCGNIPGHYGHSDTICPSCGSVVVRRKGYATSIEALSGGVCARCGAALKIIQ